MVKKSKCYLVRKSSDYYRFVLEYKKFRLTCDQRIVIPLPLDFVNDFKNMTSNQILEWNVRVVRDAYPNGQLKIYEAEFKSFLDVYGDGYNCFIVPFDVESVIRDGGLDAAWTVHYFPTDKRLVDSTLVTIDYTPFSWERKRKSL